MLQKNPNEYFGQANNKSIKKNNLNKKIYIYIYIYIYKIYTYISESLCCTPETNNIVN